MDVLLEFFQSALVSFSTMWDWLVSPIIVLHFAGYGVPNFPVSPLAIISGIGIQAFLIIHLVRLVIG